jgi:hypothetical protein
LAALLVSLKIYPIIGLACIGFGLIIHSYQNRSISNPILHIVSGGLLCLSLQGYVLFDELSVFISHFNQLVGHKLSTKQYSHTLYFFHPNLNPWLTIGIAYSAKLVLLVLWCWVSVKYIRYQPTIVFLGALAISTYFGGVSYDYNLITIFPLLTILLISSVTTEKNNNRYHVLGLSGVFIFFTLKAIYAIGVAYGFPVKKFLIVGGMAYLQWAWLCMIALFFLFKKLTIDNVFTAEKSNDIFKS